MCDIYDDIDLLKIILNQTIHQCFMHPVTGLIHFKDLSIDVYRFVDEYVDDENIDCDFDTAMLKYKKYLKSLTWGTYIMSSRTCIVVSNRTGNTDNRGGGCGDLNLSVNDFRVTINGNDDGITLGQLTEAVYRMKGSKYDWWYELFTGISQISSDPLTLEVTFDYGS